MEHSALGRMGPCPDDLGHSVELSQAVELGHFDEQFNLYLRTNI
jgi:hypothetical protein